MFNSSQKNTVDRPTLKFDYKHYSLPSLKLVNEEKIKFLLTYLDKMVL